MLDFDYPKHYAELAQAIMWEIELPEDWIDYFHQSGVVPPLPGERRGNQRRIVRLPGMMCVEQALPSISQPKHLFGVYTKDFSKDSCGILTPFQLYPETLLRLILPTFWLKLRVARVRRISKTCYDTGFSLVQRHDPNRSAFILGGNFLHVGQPGPCQPESDQPGPGWAVRC